MLSSRSGLRIMPAILWLALAAPILKARADFFTDETAFRAAISNQFTQENFDVGYSNFQQIASLPALGITFDAFSNGKFPAAVDTSVPGVGGLTRSGAFVLVNNDKAALPGLGPIEVRPVSLGQGIFALGYWNTGLDDRTTLSFFDANDQLIESGTSPAVSDNLSFIGIVTARPAYRVEISAFSGNGFFSLDNLEVQVRAVPEPASLISATLGLAGLVGYAGWRRVRVIEKTKE